MTHDDPGRADAGTITSFFAEYRKLRQFEDFFDGYRAVVSPSGRLPSQNFLIGSELLHEDEVRWCRVLGWLLDPNACARLAGNFQRRFCKKWTGAKLNPDELLKTKREERLGENRFDITLTNEPRNRIVIEAKVNAGYDEDQQERYAATLPDYGFGVYVTRRKLDAVNRKRRWQNCTWQNVADLLLECLSETDESTNRLDEQRWRIIAQDFIDVIGKEEHK